MQLPLLPTPPPLTDWQRVGLWFSGATDDRPACLQAVPQSTRAPNPTTEPAPVVPAFWHYETAPCGCVYRVRRLRVLERTCGEHAPRWRR